MRTSLGFLLGPVLVGLVLGCGGRPSSPSDDGPTPLQGHTPDAGPHSTEEPLPRDPPDAGEVPDGASPSDGPDAATPPPPRPEWPALQTRLRDYALAIAPADLELLHDRLDRELQVPGTLTHQGRSWTVQVGFRGRSSLNFPKKSFDIDFTDADPFEGRKHMILLGEWKDGGYLTVKLWHDLAAAAGLRVPWTRYANLTLNGAYYGVMVEIERVDKAFLRTHGFWEDSDIYRCGQNDCELRDDAPDPDQDPWEKKTNETAPWDELWAFLHGVNHTPAEGLVRFLEQNLALDEYLGWLAVDAAISLSGVEDSRSYLIYDRARRTWTYVPWDLNNAHSLYNRTEPIDTPPMLSKPLLNYTAYNVHVPAHWSSLSTRIFDDPGLRARFAAKLEALLAGPFREEILGPRAEAVAALLAPDVARDPFVDRDYAARSADFLQRYVRGRREALRSALLKLAGHGRTALLIDRVGRDAQGRVFVDLLNTSGSPQPLDALFLTGRLRVPDQAPLSALPALPPRGAQRVWQRVSTQPPRPEDVALSFQDDHLEVGLFGSDGKPLDVLFLPPLPPGTAYGRVPSGSESFGTSAVP